MAAKIPYPEILVIYIYDCDIPAGVDLNIVTHLAKLSDCVCDLCACHSFSLLTT